MSASGTRAGIDIGGTFTDAVQLDRGGNLRVSKVRTTPNDFARGFTEALDALSEASGVPSSEIEYLVHGTTVATNAIVQGRAARVGLLTTAGFRDVLEIGTQLRPALYDLHEPKAAPLVGRELRLEVIERIGPEGQVIEGLDSKGVEAAARSFADLGVEAVAVCFLFSFVNPSHEKKAGELLERLMPDVPVTLSSSVAPEFREYQRASTTVLNASLLPLVGSYIDRLGASLTGAGVEAPLHLMQSNGGVATARTAARLPVGLIASGPAAGVLGGARIAGTTGDGDVLTFDMGGTTADVGLVIGGEPQLRYSGEAAGHPVNLPQIDVLSVGAGGGSIARVDDFGALRVGPESAGADPGPAAYGAGGTQATVTDAHVVLGTLDPDRFLGGRMSLDREAAERAIKEDVSGPLGHSLEEAAAAVLRMANATMAGALRVVSVARGHDPRRLALVAFGGAGPMHACAIAEELGIDRIVVPRYPGVSSALGLLLSDLRHDLRRTWIRRTSEIEPSELTRALGELGEEGRAVLADAGFSDGGVSFSSELDMRYRGQAYELTVPLEEQGGGSDQILTAAERAFHAEHERTYGHASPVDEVEIVTLRVHAMVDLGARQWSEEPPAEAGAQGREREVWVPGEGRVPHRVVSRDALPGLERLEGPALVEQDDSTVVVPDGWSLSHAGEAAAIAERGR
jgi:N-methylhydantoinase A